MASDLHEIIIFLEQNLQYLADQLTKPELTEADRERLQEDLDRTETYLAHCRQSSKLE